MLGKLGYACVHTQNDFQTKKKIGYSSGTIWVRLRRIWIRLYLKLNLSFSSFLFNLNHFITHLWSDPPLSHFSANGSGNPPSDDDSSQLVMTCSSFDTVGQRQQQLTTSNSSDPPTSSQQLARFSGDQRT